MTTARKLYTAAELLALPDDGRRYELIRGELIEMAPASSRHGVVAYQIGWLIGTFVIQRNLGRSWAAETGVFIQRNPDTVRAPDYAFISHERLGSASLTDGYSEIIPDLVVEVVSPNDSRRYVADKIRMWLDAGARLALVVHPATQEIVAHYDDGSEVRFGMGDTLTCEPVLPGFSCAVADIFAY